MSTSIIGTPRRAAAGVAFVFGLNGLAVASWFARVPAARAALGLTAGELGLVLLCLSVGAILAMLTAGEITHRLGPRRAVGVSTGGVAAGLATTGCAIGAWPSPVAAGAGLFVLGYGSGIGNVAMNVEAAAVERLLGRTVMPRFHAAWSLGTVAGAGSTAAAAWLELPITAHLTAIALLTLLGTVFAARGFRYGGTSAGRGGSGVLKAWREPRTLLIGLLVLVLAFTEGTANDWLAVAFADGHSAGQAAGAVVFGLFVTTMTAGRVLGTHALDRWGRAPVLTGTMLLAATGVLLVVLAPTPLAIAGVLLWGLGASLGFPVGMSAAADDASHASARVSVVSVIGYTAFLAGPPALGLLGDHLGVLRALLVLPVLLVPALALVPVLRPRQAS